MTSTTQVAPSAIEISHVVIRQDDHGRYCLNDLHKAAGNNIKHKPANWLQTQQAQDLITELEKDDDGIPSSGNQAVSKTQGFGKAQGTYVVKELVYAYAMWISASFSLKVIRAYDALHQSPAEPETTTSPLPPPLRTKILFSLDSDVITQEVVPFGCCVVDPDSLDSLKILVNTEISARLLPELMDLVSLRIGRYLRNVNNLWGPV